MTQVLPHTKFHENLFTRLGGRAVYNYVINVHHSSGDFKLIFLP